MRKNHLRWFGHVQKGQNVLNFTKHSICSDNNKIELQKPIEFYKKLNYKTCSDKPGNGHPSMVDWSV